MPENIFFTKKVPLTGDIDIEASTISSINIIAAALFVPTSITLYNLPNVEIVKHAITLLTSIGADIKWLTSNSVSINSQNITSNILKGDPRVTLLLLPVLLEKFGKVVVEDCTIIDYIERYSDISYLLNKFGVTYMPSDSNCTFLLNSPVDKDINIKGLDYLGTILALLFTFTLKGKTITFVNFLNDPEVSDLLNFMSEIGVNISREEGTNISISHFEFNYIGRYTLASDINLVVFFSLAALVTQGNIRINNVSREYLTSFLNFLTKTGALFDLTGAQLKVWSGTRNMYSSDISVGNHPNLMSDWLCMLCVFLSRVQGKSIVKLNTLEALTFVRDLSTVGVLINTHTAEGVTTLTIEGDTKLRQGKLLISNVPNGLAYVLLALSTDAKIEISNIAVLDNYYEDLFTKINHLLYT